MISIAICDDDEQMLAELRQSVEQYMKKHGLLYVIKLFPAAEILLNEWQSFDIVFLDIQMKNLNGMQAAHRIRKFDQHCSIIFVTVLKEFVFDAFEVKADNYLIKPISGDKLSQTLDRIINQLKNKDERSLTIQKCGELWRVKIADILYCEVIKRIVYLHLADEVKDYYETIEHLEKILPPQFFRCHRSYLINLKWVQSYGNNQVKMKNGEFIPVSRLRQPIFLQAMLNYMKMGGA